MKKISLFCIFVLFLGSLMALESDPSDVVGFVKYPCVITTGTNLNLVTLSMDAGYTNASDLGNAIGNTICNTVSKWDVAGQGWIQASYVPPMGWGGDFALTPGFAYMINVTSDVDVFINGDLINQPQYNLSTTTGTNLNLIMVPINRSDLAMASNLGDDIGNTICNTVSKWDASGQGWIQASYVPPMGWGGDFAISIADPLMINVTSNTSWPIVDGDNNISKKLWKTTINQDNSDSSKASKMRIYERER